MKKELSPAAIAGTVAGLVIFLGVVGFAVFREKPPEKHPSQKANDKIPVMPAAGPPPQWFVDKIRNGGK